MVEIFHQTQQKQRTYTKRVYCNRNVAQLCSNLSLVNTFGSNPFTEPAFRKGEKCHSCLYNPKEMGHGLALKKGNFTALVYS